jgi:hypothetical protein
MDNDHPHPQANKANDHPQANETNEA